MSGFGRSWPYGAFLFEAGRDVIHRRLYYKLIMFLERKIYRDPGVRLVAVSSLVAAQLKSHFQRGDVTVIPNAVDAVRFNPEARKAKRNASRQFLSYAESDFVLLLIGNDWKKKGLDTLLKTVALLSELPLRLLIVGSDDPDLFRPSLRQPALQGRVHFEKPSADVLFFYAAADLYVGPSLEDAFNLPILEAMACGLPVIASAHAGASEMIRDGETGLILRDPQDHVELVHLIRRIYEDEKLRLTMGEVASRHVLANCGWEENTEKMREFLRKYARRLVRGLILHFLCSECSGRSLGGDLKSSESEKKLGSTPFCAVTLPHLRSPAASGAAKYLVN